MGLLSHTIPIGSLLSTTGPLCRHAVRSSASSRRRLHLPRLSSPPVVHNPGASLQHLILSPSTGSRGFSTTTTTTTSTMSDNKGANSKSDVPQLTKYPKGPSAEEVDRQKAQPGLEHAMKQKPVVAEHSERHDVKGGGQSGESEAGEHLLSLETYRGVGKLQRKRALITGGDSGIGRAVAVLFAKERAEAVALVYLEREEKDAQETKHMIEAEGHTRCVLVPADLSRVAECERAVRDAAAAMDDATRDPEDPHHSQRRIDVLVNNASQQFVSTDFADVSADQIEETFRHNILNYLHVTRVALPLVPRGGNIINTASVTAFKGKPQLVDYAATKGAMVAFTRSLAMQVAERGIRVNAVAPGPIWTPLIPASFPKEMIEKFGQSTALKRMGQPIEVATSYVFLASADSSYMTGQTLHPNGGEIVGS